MRRFVARRQQAQAIGLAAVVMVAMVGALALVVDLGFQQMTRRELQNAATAAALAGVVKLPDFQQQAIDDANDYAAKPSNTGIADRLCQTIAAPLPDVGAAALAGHPKVYGMVTPGQIPIGGGYIYTLTVTLECTTGFSFGRILNLDTASIRATATAAIGSPRAVSCAFPVSVWDEDGNAANGMQDSYGISYAFGQTYPLYVKGDPLGSGNSGFIDVGHETGDIFNAIAGDCSDWDSNMGAGDTPFTEPGLSSGPIEVALVSPPMQRMADCTDPSPPSLCSTTFTNISLPGAPSGITITPDYACRDTFADVIKADGTLKKPDSECLVVVPVVSDVISGKKQVTIQGFAMFFLAAYGKDGSNRVMVGQFVKATIGGADITAYVPGFTASRLIR